MEILVDDGLDDGDAVPATNLGAVTVSADLHDENLAVDGGCDPNGCIPSNTQVVRQLRQRHNPQSGTSRPRASSGAPPHRTEVSTNSFRCILLWLVALMHVLVRPQGVADLVERTVWKMNQLCGAHRRQTPSLSAARLFRHDFVLMQDGELADMSRWSCSPKLAIDGSDATCSISYTFTAALELTELRLGKVAFSVPTLHDISRSLHNCCVTVGPIIPIVPPHTSHVLTPAPYFGGSVALRACLFYCWHEIA